jgi:hypothetical protein
MNVPLVRHAVFLAEAALFARTLATAGAVTNHRVNTAGT